MCWSARTGRLFPLRAKDAPAGAAGSLSEPSIRRIAIFGQDQIRNGAPPTPAPPSHYGFVSRQEKTARSFGVFVSPRPHWLDPFDGILRRKLAEKLRATNWFTGVLGGVVAASAFCALVFAGYAVPALGLGFLVTLGLVLPSLTGLLWPFLGAKAQAPPN